MCPTCPSEHFSSDLSSFGLLTGFDFEANTISFCGEEELGDILDSIDKRD